MNQTFTRGAHQLFTLYVFEPPRDIQRRLPGLISWRESDRNRIVTVATNTPPTFLPPISRRHKKCVIKTVSHIEQLSGLFPVLPLCIHYQAVLLMSQQSRKISLVRKSCYGLLAEPLLGTEPRVLE